MAATRILWQRTLLIFAWLCVGGSAWAQNAVGLSGPGSITIDASHLNAVISLDAPWRFHADDDARFADPDLDDSGWPLVYLGEARPLAASHIPPVTDGKDWLRLHLHILDAHSPLSISLLARNGTPYEIFANGKKIGATADFEEANPKPSRPFVVSLPQATEIVLAIHFATRGGMSVHWVPLEQVEIGQAQEVGELIELERYRRFERNALVDIAIVLLCLTAIPFGLVLSLAQRNHPEFIWLAVLCGVEGLLYLSDSLVSTYGFPGQISISISKFIFAAEPIFLVEFVFIMAERRRLTLVRSIQALLLVVPVLSVLYQYSLPVHAALEFVELCGSVLTLTLIGYLLLSAYLRGNRECGFLLLPALLIPLTDLKSTIELYDSLVLGPVWGGQLGGVGFSLRQVASLLFIAGVLAVVFYRFIRVSKDEELAAAELEAARTVQRLLIPATAPATPGFSVESVYLPARQVGGDFFLVLPALEGSGDESLLAIMGDVSGKGLQAAMIVSTIIGGLRMQISRRPGEVLTHLNRILTGHVSGFATCCAVLIEPDGQMRIANAGNPSPYLGGEEVPTLPGLPLGLAAEMLYEETTGVLEHGQRLTFVSDGVIEATSATGKELFGFDRTQEISVASASAIAETAMLFGKGAPQADDITVLTVSRA